MTAHLTAVQTAASVIEAASNKVPANTEVASDTTPAHADTVAPVNAPVTAAEAPQFNTTYCFTVIRVIRHKDGNPFLLKGFVSGMNIAGTVHASAIIGDSKTDRDLRFNQIKESDVIDVELLEKVDGYRFSERLAAQRQELTALSAESKLTAVVLEDANEDTESLYVIIGGKHKARIHASNLKESSRESRDARIKTLKKDETLNVTIKAFARHQKYPVFQISCQEVGRQEKPAFVEKPRRTHKVASPLGNRTGDRAAAEAKRAARRQRDQIERNKMKGSSGKK
jgi:hypothetical protein